MKRPTVWQHEARPLFQRERFPISSNRQFPYTVAKGMAKSAIWERQQERWLKVLTEHLSDEHLSRIQVGVRSQSMFSVGNRRTQTTLAQLRFGHTKLNAHQFRFMAVETPICDCGGAEEFVAHYPLECPLFDSHRFFLVRTVTAILPFGVELFGEHTTWRLRVYLGHSFLWSSCPSSHEICSKHWPFQLGCDQYFWQCSFPCSN